MQLWVVTGYFMALGLITALVGAYAQNRREKAAEQELAAAQLVDATGGLRIPLPRRPGPIGVNAPATTRRRRRRRRTMTCAMREDIIFLKQSGVSSKDAANLVIFGSKC